MKKYTSSLLRYFGFYLIGFAFFGFISNPMREILRGVLPFAFPSYNPVTEKDAYLAMCANADLVSAILTVLLVSVIAVRFDNTRHEIIISKTDGFYKIIDCMPLYLSEFAAADVVSATAVPLPFVFLSCFSFPDRVAEWTDMILGPTLAFTDKLGITVGAGLLIAVSLLSRLPAAVSGLDRWRGIWLADIGN